ncbi:MAG: glycosyltransferase family 4 protein [Bacteroidota bacterium]
MTERDRPLVALGAWLPGSGFTRVLQSILPRLAETREVHWIGTAYRGSVREVDGVTLHPSNLEGGDVYGGYGAARLAAEVGATDVLVLKDLWMLKNCGAPFRDLPEATRVTAYVPLDGRLRDDALVEAVTFVDRLVAFTAFGRRQFEARLARLGAEAGGATTETATIPHGVDVSAFAPLDADARREARARLLPHIPPDAFVVLNANRPVPRKRVDLTVEGFARFARSRPEAHLRLHHAHLSPDEHAQLQSWIAASGVSDQISVSSPEDGPLSEADLNALYNACDVGLNTSDGEGWGLVSFEHAATGAAQIVPANSASGELWAGAAEIVPTVRRWSPPYTLVDSESVSAEGVAAALARLADDPEHRQQIAHAGYHRAHDPAFRWDAIAERWRRLFACR